MDFEASALWPISDRDMEDDRSDLDDIVIPKNCPFDSLAIDMSVHAVIQAFQDSVFTVFGDPAMATGDLWKRDSQITGQITAYGHFLMMHGKDPLVISLSLHDQLQWQHSDPSAASRVDWTYAIRAWHRNMSAGAFPRKRQLRSIPST